MTDSAEHLAAMRRQYTAQGLAEDDLAPTWLEQLRTWLRDAERHGVLEPNAMVLATAGADGAVSSRTVLLKGLDERGLVFFTNYDSRKGRQLTENPQASITFPWHALQRQVQVEGAVQRISAEDSDAYWATRPPGSRVGALASPQSQPITRGDLEAAFARIAAAGTSPDRPAHWGGYVLAPERVEFWQGRADRLHDRLQYRHGAGGWGVERLAP